MASNETSEGASKVVKSYNCIHCKKEFNHAGNRSRHQQICKQRSDRPPSPKPEPSSFVCTRPWCDRSFSRKLNRDRHVAVCQSKDALKKCFICKKEFARGTHLRRHLETHSAGTAKKMKCPNCCKLFRHQDKYNLHLAICTPASMVNDPYYLYTDADSNHDDINHSTYTSILPNPSSTISTNDSPIPVDFMSHSNISDSIIDHSHNFSSDDFAKNDSFSSLGFSITHGLPHPDASNDFLSYTSLDPYANVSTVPDLSSDDSSDSKPAPVPGAADNDQTISEVHLVEPQSSNDHCVPSSNDHCVPSFCFSDDPTTVDNAAIHILPEGTDLLSTDPTIQQSSPADYERNLDILTKATKRYLMNMKHRAKYSLKMKIRFSKFLKEFFGDRLNDESFKNWLSRELNIDNFDDVIQYSETTSITGRPIKLTREVKMKVQDFWRANSVISVDRRNLRNLVNVSSKNVKRVASDLLADDLMVSKVLTKRGWKYQADRYISTKTFRYLYTKFIEQNNISISYGSFIQLKPFYIFPPTSREKESCLCIICLNIHCLYNAVRFNIKDKTFPSSLTSYLTSTIKCADDQNLEFPKFDCLTGNCDNGCTINVGEEIQNDDIVSFYQFESVEEKGYSKKGTVKKYNRTARVDKKAPLNEVFQLLQDCAKKYIIHRYFVISFKVFWEKFHSQYEHSILTFDYSENIQFKPKFEAQSGHFSGKQQTLHCCVHEIDNEFNYVYHLSDDKHHDSIMTFAIIQDIIEKEPSVIASGTLVLRSDNCSTQYKSRFVFYLMKKIAVKYSIRVVWFYGEAGHGRGLVDAMSCFGCKGPLRWAIIVDDMWFSTADEMKDYLISLQTDDSRKYYTIDPAVTATGRRKTRKEHALPGCQKMHLISVNSNGEFTTRVFLDSSDENLLKLNFEDGEADENILLPVDVEEMFKDDDLIDHENEKGIIEKETLFSLIYPDTFIALRSPPSSCESFYIVKVVSKAIAEANIKDDYGHTVCAGEEYISGFYLNRVFERKNSVQFSIPKKSSAVLIHLKEIFSIDIEISPSLTLDIKEFNAINQELY